MPAKPAQTSSPALLLRVVDDEESFLALEPHWDALLEQSAVRTPFMSWDWVSIRWQQLSARCRLCVGVVDDPATGTPIAIAPLFIGRGHEGPRKALRILTFLGALGDVPSQGMDFLVPAGREQELTPLLCGVFRKTLLHWDVIDLPNIHGVSPNLALIKEALSHFSRPGERMAPQTCYYMTLPSSWDEQMGLWRSKERCIYRSKWRKLLDEHAGRALLGGRDLPVSEAFEHLWRVHGLRFKEMGKPSLFLNDESRSFHTQFIERWANKGGILLPLLEADGAIAAARYGIAYNGIYWSFQAGYDPAYSQMSIGKLSLGWTVQCSIEHGLNVVDHLPGGSGYKEEWSTDTRTVYHPEAWNPMTPASLLFRGLRSLKRRRNAAVEGPTVEVTA